MTLAARRLSVDERRAHLLARGLELFASRSYDDVAIEEIAASAGVSKGLLYHYFAGKREFYVAVVSAAFENVREATEPDPTTPVADQLTATLDRFLAYAQENASGWAWLLGTTFGTDLELTALGDRFRDTVVQRVLRNAAAADPPSPTLLTAVRGWVAYAGAATLTWLQVSGRVPGKPDTQGDVAGRTEMVALLALSLRGALDAVVAVEPAALRIDLRGLDTRGIGLRGPGRVDESGRSWT